jgi:hypothetical protein
LENAALIKERLEALRGVIAAMLAIEVGLDFGATEQSADVALYSQFESRAALAAYQAVRPARNEESSTTSFLEHASQHSQEARRARQSSSARKPFMSATSLRKNVSPPTA